jgi:GH24 family phage-related lysozyme (muramidase)
MGNLEKIKKMIIEHEGSIPHMYLDTVGKVTVGVGFMLPSPEAAKKMKFIDRETGEPATDNEIERDFNAVQDQEKGNRAQYYEQFTRLDLPDEEIDSYLEKRIEEFQNGLRGKFDDYDNYPEAAREGLLDMAFNLGVEGLVNKFPTFTAAAREGDWAKCAQECHRRNIGEERNETTKKLFDEAALA